MEAVKMFNSELTSLYDTRPPISKAKMTSITRTAIKAIKFYKHVVQSVEKFIQKCKPEYKVPGLYVIDSIVRQSRHQFSAEKDVFAPRFARNIQNTFHHLFNCPHDDKGKIVRVLNLWQKNQVFTPEVIQPLLDMASLASKDQLHPSNGVQLKSPAEGKPSPAKDQPMWMMSNQDLNSSTPQTVKFDKKLLDYDYGEEEDEEAISPKQQIQTQAPIPSLDSLTSILSNPEVLLQLQTLQQQMSARQQQQADQDEKLRRLQEMRHQEEEFDKHLAQTLPNLPFAAECDFKPSSASTDLALQHILSSQPQPVGPPQGLHLGSQDYPHSYRSSTMDEGDRPVDYDERTRNMPPQRGTDNGGVVEVIDLIRMDSPSRDSPPSRRRRRSRSRSRGRRSRSRSRRRRSRSDDREYDRDWDSRKVRESEREKERERRRKGLPPIKKSHLAVCSTTLWIGHLSKLVQQEELSDTFGEYGDIVSINLIPPRGCAFVCMNRRQDAAKALQQLKHYKLQGKAITIAWAPGKGMKDKEWKDYWEVEQGVSYIPWTKLSSDTDFDLLEEGGMLDEETFPDWLKENMAMKRGKDRQQEGGGGEENMITDPTGMVGRPEIDVAQMANAAMPGFIPLPDGTNSGPQGNLPPPPMGLIPPFALPPNNVGLMGPMGMPPGLMGNVPLGVPPPLMMSQQMVPRMPASPFNAPLLLGNSGGSGGPQDKNKLGVPNPNSAEGFPDLASMHAFGLPMPMPSGLNAGGMMQNKGPAEMDVEDLGENEMIGKENMRNNNQGLGLMGPMLGGFGQGGPMPFVNPMGLLPGPPGDFNPSLLQGGGPGKPDDMNKDSIRPLMDLMNEDMDDMKGNEDTDMRGNDDRKGRRRDSPGRDRRGTRRREWGKPRVNRWGDAREDHPDRNERRGRSPGMDRMNNKEPPPERQSLLGLPMGGGDHFQQPSPRQMGLMGPYGGGGGGGHGGYMDRDDRGSQEDMNDYPPPLMSTRPGYFPRGGGGPRPNGPRPLLRTPNGPMFGPRNHPPPSLMGMRGMRPGPGGNRMDYGGPMRGYPSGGRGGRGGGGGGRYPGPRERRWEEGPPRGRWHEEERKSRWSSHEEERSKGEERRNDSAKEEDVAAHIEPAATESVAEDRTADPGPAEQAVEPDPEPQQTSEPCEDAPAPAESEPPPAASESEEI